ncbi:MAG: cysteine rich repeat-containing protein [Elusimicrobiota bacterium]|jgi:Golgi apparatus protein 1
MTALRTLAALLLLCAGAAAAEPQPAPQGDAACKADAEKFCKDVTPGKGRLILCLKAHDDKLAPECRERLKKGAEEMRERRSKAKEACQEDVDKFCKSVDPGKDVLACLKEHAAELSASCQKVREDAQARMKELKERQEKVKTACKGDLDKFCKGVEAGGGRLAKCLKEHEAELSESCRALKPHKDEKERPLPKETK